jgi:sugar/nucleoside kinase (ribokinase family)
MKEFDVVGVGLNATDTMILIPHMPSYGGKVPFLKEVMSPGGQVASAIVCCSMLGLKAKYIGTIGDDERGEIQMQSLLGTGVNLDHVQRRKGCPNQSAYILIDQTTGERTVFWSRPDCLKIDPEEITEDQITCAKLLHIDGHDTAARSPAPTASRSPSTSTPSTRASKTSCPMSTTSSHPANSPNAGPARPIRSRPSRCCRRPTA